MPVNILEIISNDILADCKDERAKLDLKDSLVNQGSKVSRVKLDQMVLQEHQGWMAFQDLKDRKEKWDHRDLRLVNFSVFLLHF